MVYLYTPYLFTPKLANNCEWTEAGLPSVQRSQNQTDHRHESRAGIWPKDAPCTTICQLNPMSTSKKIHILDPWKTMDTLLDKWGNLPWPGYSLIPGVSQTDYIPLFGTQCGTQSYQLHHFQAPCSMLKFDSQKLELATFTDCRSFQWSITAWTDWSALPAFYLARFTSWIVLARTEMVFFAPQHWRNNGAVEKGPPMACPKTEPRSIGCVWDFGTMWDIPRNAWHLVACDDQFLLFWDIPRHISGMAHPIGLQRMRLGYGLGHHFDPAMAHTLRNFGTFSLWSGSGPSWRWDMLEKTQQRKG